MSQVYSREEQVLLDVTEDNKKDKKELDMYGGTEVGTEKKAGGLEKKRSVEEPANWR